MNQSPDTAVITDPFFEAVARRHPDIDLIVLAAPEPDGEPTSDERLAQVMIEIAALARDLWRQVAGPETEPLARFSYGDTPGSVRAEARCRAEREDGSDVIDRLANALLAGGWELHRPSGGVPRLRARRESVEVVTSYVAHTGAVLFRVSGPSLTVGTDRARELARNGGR